MFVLRRKYIQKIKMDKICLQFDIVIISPFRKMRIFDG